MEMTPRAKLLIAFSVALAILILSISLKSDKLNVLLEGKVKWYDVQNGEGYVIKEGWWTNKVYRYDKAELSQLWEFSSDNYCLEGNKMVTIKGTVLTTCDLSELPVKPISKKLRYEYTNDDGMILSHENYIIYDCIVEGESSDYGIVCINLDTLQEILLVKEICLWWLEGSQIRYVYKYDIFDMFDLNTMQIKHIHKRGSDTIIEEIGGLSSGGEHKTIPISEGVFIRRRYSFYICDSDLKLKIKFSWYTLINMIGKTISNNCVYYSQRLNTGSREALLFPKFFAKENGLWVWNWKDNSHTKLNSSILSDLEVSGDRVYGRKGPSGRMYSIDTKSGAEEPVWK